MKIPISGAKKRDRAKKRDGPDIFAWPFIALMRFKRDGDMGQSEDPDQRDGHRYFLNYEPPAPARLSIGVEATARFGALLAALSGGLILCEIVFLHYFPLEDGNIFPVSAFCAVLVGCGGALLSCSLRVSSAPRASWSRRPAWPLATIYVVGQLGLFLFAVRDEDAAAWLSGFWILLFPVCTGFFLLRRLGRPSLGRS